MSKQNHNQWTWTNNVNITHQAMPSVVHGLRKESQIVTMACGSVFASSLNSIFGGQMDDIYSQCLITDTHACSRHTDPDFFHWKTQRASQPAGIKWTARPSVAVWPVSNLLVLNLGPNYPWRLHALGPFQNVARSITCPLVF